MQKREQEIYDFMQRHKEEIVADIIKLVKAQSPSRNKAYADQCADVIQEIAKERTGLTAEVIDQEETGKNLVFTYGDSSLVEKVIIVGHFDTVWDVDALPVKQEGDLLYGPGIFDMKAGLISAIWSIKAIKDLEIPINHRIILFCNSDEEIGSINSRPHIKKYSAGCKAALITEPSEGGSGNIKNGRKGGAVYHVTIHGKAAHAGNEPWSGVNALDEMARQILYIHTLNDYEQGTTLNVDMASGGNKINVIADKAELWVDCRVCTFKEADRIHDLMMNLKPVNEGITLEVEGHKAGALLEDNEANRRLYQKVQECAADLDMEIHAVFAGGCSDGNYTSTWGIPTIDGMGAVGNYQHAVKEHIVISRHVERMPLLTSVLCRL